MVYTSVSAPFAVYTVITAPIPSIANGEGVEGQLRDDVTGALLYDAVTGAPLTW